MTDTGFLVPESKCQKLNDIGDAGLTTGLNDLPNVIIQYILSLLPAREAVRTSVLSKRWKYLWASMPKLVFREGCYDKTLSRFMNIVNRVFIFHDSSNIETFHISLYVKDDIIAYRLRTWIVAAVRRKVQQLIVQCHVEYVPSCVFTCKTLVELRISVSILKLPPSICLSGLKVLSLSFVKFVQSISLQELLSLPVLEELTLCQCDWKDLKILNISAPKLLKLSIINCSSHDNTPNSFHLLIDGSSLKSFEFRGRLNYSISISAASLLGSATLDIHYPYYHHEGGDILYYRVHKLLLGLINSRYLSLSSVAIEALYHRSELLDSFPLFYNLMGLGLNGQKFNFDCQAPFAILTKFPCLEWITFHQGIKLQRKRENYSSILYPFPPCLMNLKKIVILDFDFIEREMIVLRELLVAAKFLKEMVIEGSYSFRKLEIEQEKVVNDLKALLKWSEDCIITFKPTLYNADTIFIHKHM